MKQVEKNIPSEKMEFVKYFTAISHFLCFKTMKEKPCTFSVLSDSHKCFSIVYDTLLHLEVRLYLDIIIHKKNLDA